MRAGAAARSPTLWRRSGEGFTSVAGAAKGKWRRNAHFGGSAVLLDMLALLLA